MAGKIGAQTNAALSRSCVFAALIVGLLTAADGYAQEAGMADAVDLSVKVINQSAFGLDETVAQRFLTRVEPHFEVDLGRFGSFVAIARAEIDGFDEIEPGRPDQLERDPANRRLLLGDRASVELREAYWEGGGERLFFRLGKQQTVWGTADGIKVLDVVNPQSFRAFILDEFDVSRIPLWTVKTFIDLGGAELETVWIPDTTYDELPDQGALFEITSPLLGPAPFALDRPVFLADPERPDRSLADGDAGARLSALVAGWDLTVLYLYHNEDRPLFDIGQTPVLTTVTPIYNRVHLGGVTLSKAFGKVVLRTELGYTHDRGYAVALASSPNGLDFADNLSFVVGLDVFDVLPGLLSVQYFQDTALEDLPGLVRPQHLHYTTVTWRAEFANDRLQTDLRWLTNLNNGDGLLRFRVTYEVSDTVSVNAGMEAFYGDSEGVFGQFSRADRVVMGMTLGF